MLTGKVNLDGAHLIFYILGYRQLEVGVNHNILLLLFAAVNISGLNERDQTNDSLIKAYIHEMSVNAIAERHLH